MSYLPTAHISALIICRSKYLPLFAVIRTRGFETHLTGNDGVAFFFSVAQHISEWFSRSCDSIFWLLLNYIVDIFSLSYQKCPISILCMWTSSLS